jgi:hypothetical protein
MVIPMASLFTLTNVFRDCKDGRRESHKHWKMVEENLTNIGRCILNSFGVCGHHRADFCSLMEGTPCGKRREASLCFSQDSWPSPKTFRPTISQKIPDHYCHTYICTSSFAIERMLMAETSFTSCNDGLSRR